MPFTGFIFLLIAFDWGIKFWNNQYLHLKWTVSLLYKWGNTCGDATWALCVIFILLPTKDDVAGCGDEYNK